MLGSEDAYCVLVVEDQPIILENMKEELEDESFRVLAAGNAKEARHFMDRCGEDICAAFVDIDLGPGEDGYGVARYARSVKPDLRVIYTSGGPRGALMDQRVSGSVFVAKPYRPSEVGALLRDLLSPGGR